MKPSSMLLVLGVLVLPIVEGAPSESSSKKPDTDAIAERAQAAYEAAMKTVAASQQTWLAAQAPPKPVQLPANPLLKHTIALKKLNETEELEELRKKEEKEHAELEAANEKAEKLEEELGSTQEELNEIRAAKKALHDRNSMAASNAEMMMHDMHSTLSDERDVRLAAEKNASTLSTKLVSMTKSRDKLLSELALSKSLVKMKVNTNANMTSALDDAHTETEGLRQKFEGMTKASDQKAGELQKELEHFQELDLEDRELLNKTKEESAEEIKKIKKVLTGKLNKSEALRLWQKKKAFKLFAKTVKQVKKLQKENTRVKMHFIKHHKLMDKVRARLTRTNNMLKDEHKQGVNIQNDAAEAQNQLAIVTEKLQKARHDLHVAEQHAQDLKDQQGAVEEKTERKDGKLQQAKAKLQRESEALRETQRALRQSIKALHRQDHYKDNARKNLRKLWAALKAKRDQLKVHDEQLEEVRMKLDAAEANEKKLKKQLLQKRKDDGRFVKVENLDKLQEKDLEALHEHFKAVQKEERDLKAAHAKLAIAQDSLQGQLDPSQQEQFHEHMKEQQEKYKLAIAIPAPDAEHAQILNITNTQLDQSKKELEDTQDKLKELNAQLEKDESGIPDVNATAALVQLRGSK